MGCTELRVLDTLKHVDRVWSVNLWENKLTTDSLLSLEKFRNVVDLQLRDNCIDRVDVFKCFRRLQLLNLQNNSLSWTSPTSTTSDCPVIGSPTCLPWRTPPPGSSGTCSS